MPDKVRINDKRRAERVSYTDPLSLWSIGPDEEKELPKNVTATLRSRLISGFLVKVVPPPPAPEKKEPKEKK